ncbi:MAG: YajQ family cyclic di-GMP-binding protein [Mariprofundaceae bacterium]
MSSFDIVCEIDMHEMDNAINQTDKEITTRYDFKGSGSTIEMVDSVITICATDENKLNTICEILRAKMVRRNLEPKYLEYGEPEAASGDSKRQKITLKMGVDKELAKKVVKLIKQEKMKVQASIQGDQVRITGKKRDDLQAAIALVKSMDADRPLQYTNFRD